MRKTVFLAVVSLLVVHMQNGYPQDHPLLKEAPAYDFFRHRQHYDYLTDSSVVKDGSDKIKLMPLGRVTRLSLGGDVRQILERFRYEAWNGNSGRAYFLQLYHLHADISTGKSLRFFGELGSAWGFNRQGGDRFIDQDELFLFQGFADVNFPMAGSSATLRLGRQVLDYGTGLMLSLQAGPNLSQVHDGASLDIRRGHLRTGIFFTKPVINRPGAFDNRWFKNKHNLWGTYHQYTLPWLETSQVDFYYMGHNRTRAVYQQGVGDEVRHTSGARFTGRTATWGFDSEVAGQWGRFAGSPIAAWMAGSIVYYTFGAIKPAPTVGLNLLYLSGDRDAGQDRLETFQAPFQKIFVGAGVPAGGNMFTIQPAASLAFSDKVKLFADYQFFFRPSRRDGVYGPYHLLLLPAEDSDQKYLGSQLNAELHWYYNRHWNAFIKGAYYVNGGLLEDLESSGRVREGMFFFRTFFTYYF